jgi:hypothetical protein
MDEKPTVARFSLASSQMTKLTAAILLAEQIHLALVKLSDGAMVFKGRDERGLPLKGHGHAHIFCESNLSLGRGEQGEVTHVTIYAPMGFGQKEKEALQGLKEVHEQDGPSIQLMLLGLGQPEDFGGTNLSVGQSPLLGLSRTWISRTPFLPTLNPKRTREKVPKRDDTGLQIDSPEHELRKLLKLAGFPTPVIVEKVPYTNLGGQEVAWKSFIFSRIKGGGRRAATNAGYGFLVNFPEAVRGPVSSGYGAHFGMGGFVADENEILTGFQDDSLVYSNFQKGDVQICMIEIKIRFLTQTHISLWAGNGFRVGLGNKLRDRICAVYVHNHEDPSKEIVNYRNCRICQIYNSCNYGRLFASFPQKIQKVPVIPFESSLPLILMPPDAGSYSPGDYATVGFVTIGPALDSLPYLFLALSDLGKSGFGRDRHIGGGRFELESADSLTPQERKKVYHSGNLLSRINTFSYSDLLRQAEELNGSLVLRFITPTHIGYGNIYSSRPSFRMVLMNLLFRANALSISHGAGYLYSPKECQDMLERSEKVEQVRAIENEVYPHRQTDMHNESDRQPPYFLGKIVYRGSFSKDIMALLSLGQIIHVGKAATIGNGIFRMEKRP